MRVREQMTLHGITEGNFFLPFPLEKDTSPETGRREQEAKLATAE